VAESMAKQYQQEMHENLGFFATWLPGDHLDVGDIGVLQGGRFRRQSSLSEMGIGSNETAKGASQNLQYTSKSGTSVSVEGRASSLGMASSEIKIDFAMSGSFLFQATGVKNVRLGNNQALAKAIKNVYVEGKWDKRWYLIESVHVADCATVIISDDISAGLVLTASANGSLGSVPLADPKASLNVTSSRGRMVHIIGQRGLRPLYSCLRLITSWFDEPSIAPVRGEGQAKLAFPFIRPDIVDLITS
jgi:hypothetical protein